MKDPAVLFYTSDFLTGCVSLTMEERGQYITMLCLQHQQGHLSEKTISLTLGSVSVDVKKKFLVDENGLYFNERMDIEIEKRSLFTSSRANNGKKGGRPKKPSDKPSDKPLGLPSENLVENENENIIEIYKTYPSNCLVKKTRSLGKCEKNKEQIKKLLKTRSKDEIIKIIEYYKTNCVLSETYMKNFSTFLNNLPDYSEQEKCNTKKVRWTTTIDRGEKEGTEEQFFNQKRILGEENILSFEYI